MPRTKPQDAAAREYQAQRVAYLDGLYNSYGRDGLVTNPLGNETILQLAGENPTAANFYAQIYPNAKQTYERQNKLADDIITHSNQLDTLFKTFGLNSEFAKLQGNISRQNATHSAKLGRETHAVNAETDDKIAQRKDARAMDNLRKKIAGTIQLANEYPPQEAVEQLKLNLFGLTQEGGKSSKHNDTSDIMKHQNKSPNKAAEIGLIVFTTMCARLVK